MAWPRGSLHFRRGLLRLRDRQARAGDATD